MTIAPKLDDGVPDCTEMLALEEAAAKRGQGWLSRRDADVLVFGEWIEKGEALNLHFLPVGGSGDFRQHAFKLESGLLKGDFSEAVGAQLQAVALATVTPVTEESGKYLVETLRPVAVHLERLIHFPPSGLSAGQLADVQSALGLALYAIGDQAGDNKALTEAVAAYREALKERTRARVPLDWAATQSNLGNVLVILGEREKSETEKLEQAVAAYREALKEYTRERVPLQWAMTQINLGTALFRLGEREKSGTEKLEQAVAAYREALEELTREGVPLDWAMAQLNLGAALMKLGDYESGTGKDEDAVAAFRAALEGLTRERVPLLWAQAQNSLGAALESLGEQEIGTGKLEDAVAAFRAALEERTRAHFPLDWAVSFANQGVAMMVLADRKKDVVLAKTAFEQINAAYQTLQSGGDRYNADVYKERLSEALSLLDRLSAR